MSAVSELHEILREVLDRLERAAAHAGTALPLLEEAKAMMVAAKAEGGGWYPAGLDIALSEAQRLATLVANATQAVSDYTTRL